jgi:hypothetical protein
MWISDFGMLKNIFFLKKIWKLFKEFLNLQSERNFR